MKKALVIGLVVLCFSISPGFAQQERTIMVDYQVTQMTEDTKTSTIGPGAVYLGLGFRIPPETTKEFRLDITLNAVEDVSFHEASKERTRLDGDSVSYPITIKPGEHKVVWIKARLGKKAVQNGLLANLTITGATLGEDQQYQLFLTKAEDIRTNDTTRLLSMYRHGD
jgi:hypothetical protein